MGGRCNLPPYSEPLGVWSPKRSLGQGIKRKPGSIDPAPYRLFVSRAAASHQLSRFLAR